MKNEALYHKTVDILYQAYFNDKLMHGNCYACAVGNICGGNHQWRYLFFTHVLGNENVINNAGRSLCMSPDVICIAETRKAAFDLIASTGYTPNELAEVEYAFESSDKGNSNEDWMFNGLVAVLEVLKQIHEVQDDRQVQTKFKQHYQRRRVA